MPESATVPSTTPALVRVVCLRPIHEGTRTYAVDEEFEVTSARGQRLQELGFVEVLPPGALGGKLTRVRERAARAAGAAATRHHELAQIQHDVSQAQARVASLQDSTNAAERGDAQRALQDQLLEQEQRQRRYQDADRLERSAREALRETERRIAELKEAVIPREERALADRRATHARLLREAEVFARETVARAEGALAELHRELAALEGPGAPASSEVSPEPPPGQVEPAAAVVEGPQTEALSMEAAPSLLRRGRRGGGGAG